MLEHILPKSECHRADLLNLHLSPFSVQKVRPHNSLIQPSFKFCYSNVLLHSPENNEVSQLETSFQLSSCVHESITEKLI